MRDSWLTYTFKSILREPIRDFGSFSLTNLINFQDNGIPFLKSEAIQNGYIDFSKISFISEEVHRLLHKSIVRDGDLLYTKIGAICRGAIYDGSIGVCNSNAATAKIRTNTAIVDKYFILYLLLSEGVKREFEKSIISTPPRINLGDIDKLEILIPPLPQQKKIAKILTTVDNVIEKTETAIAKYQAIKQGLMHDLFTRGIDVNTGKLRPTATEAPALYKESVLGLIPKEWEVEELGKENETYAGGTPNRAIEDFYKGEIPWVASGEVNKSFIYKTKESITAEALRFSSAKMAPKESVLIAMYGATAAQVSMLKIEACSNQAVLAIIPNSLWNNYYIYYGLNYSKERILFLAQGSGQPNLNKRMIDSTQFWKPKQDEQRLIVERLNGIESKIQTEQQALAKYQQLKAGLLQDLLTGRVEVSVN
jgi:type I restriction enzyme S subunit